MAKHRRIERRRFLASLAVGAAAAQTAPAIVRALAQPLPGPRVRLVDVQTWAYQLQHVDPFDFTGDSFDLLVIDYSRDGTDAQAFSARDVAALRSRPSQPDRIVLAYLSIGEAEDYRYYWQDAWIDKTPPPAPVVTGSIDPSAPPAPNPALPSAQAHVPSSAARQTPQQRAYSRAREGTASGDVPARPPARLSMLAPSWLAEENPQWRGNFLVHYWDEQWQAMMFGSPGAYLDRILAAGFDGVYLDKIDANDDWQATRPTAEREMVDFVKRLAAYARRQRPGFLIVPQNAEELLEYPDYVEAIDAIAKEDLLYGGSDNKDGGPNPEAEIESHLQHLRKARAAGRPVLAVEYLERPELIAPARERLLNLGFVPAFAQRALDRAPPLPTPPAQPR
jgi:endo-alpha-1,4-polygalactosaminidase (GH114 family)